MRFAVDPQDALDIDDYAIPPEQYCKSPKAKATTFRCEFFESSSLKPYARTRSGAPVTAYGATSTAPTVEDTGTGRLVNGAASVSLDAVFAATIDATAPYRVLITPDGDSRGLYVASKTPAGFLVRESQGGTIDDGLRLPHRGGKNRARRRSHGTHAACRRQAFAFFGSATARSRYSRAAALKFDVRRFGVGRVRLRIVEQPPSLPHF